jgi:hypothetical protein
VSSRGAPEFIFAEQGPGVAFVVEADGKSHVVYNGRAGQPYVAVGKVVLSPDGRRHAYGALQDGRWRMVVDGKEGAAFSAVDDPVFSPDGAHLAYEGMRGDLWHLVVDETENLGTRTQYLRHEFSGDSSRLAFIEDADDADEAARGRLVISGLDFKAQTVVDNGVSTLLLSPDGMRLAAVTESATKRRVLTLSLDRPDKVRRGRPYDVVTGLVFAPDGEAVAHLGERSGRSLVVLGDKEQLLPPAATVISSLVIRPDKKAVAAIVGFGEAVSFQEFFLDGKSGAPAIDEAEGPVYGTAGAVHAYAAKLGASWFLVVNGKRGPRFDRVVSPIVSPDGLRLVYRARQDGRRFVVVADLDGRTIRQHPAHELVFPVHFTADGKSVTYGVKDGQELAWKVEAL